MSRTKGLPTAAVLALLAVSTVSILQAVDEFPSRVGYVEGSAAVAVGEELEWLELLRNMPVRSGDRFILQRDALVELELNDGSFVRLAGEADLTVRELRPERAVFLLAAGDLILRVESDRYLKVETLSCELRPAEPGVYRISTDTGGFVRAVVRSGSLHVRSGAESRLLAQGEAVEIQEAGDRLARLSHDFTRDRFDYWSDGRDAREAGLRDVPVDQYDATAGFSDLNRYGNWGYDAHYGRVWWPHQGASWAPYRLGSWLYYPSWGWTWISHEPWGWLPYHSGRWVFLTSYGRWCWVPGASSRWYPSTAHFYHSRGRVAWRPAGPGEVVRRHPVLPPEEAARSSSRLDTVSGSGEARGWTVVREDDFLTGRRVAVRNPLRVGGTSIRDLTPGLPGALQEGPATGRVERARSGWTSTEPVTVRIGSGGTRVLRSPTSGSEVGGEASAGRDRRIFGSGSSRIGQETGRERGGAIVSPRPNRGREREIRSAPERTSTPSSRGGPSVRPGSDGNEAPAVRRGRRSGDSPSPVIRPRERGGAQVRPERTPPRSRSGAAERPRPRSSIGTPSRGVTVGGSSSEVRRSPAVRPGGVRVGPAASPRQQERRPNRPSP